MQVIQNLELTDAELLPNKKSLPAMESFFI
ncbi:hypothetical protein BWGOE6_37180 [Bacillus mycoides]|nr:hypothetical protein [Bacillus sp. JUb91]OFD57548.1 hypothetical protein BWGOE6_37180 [Bacillus mycoides]